MLRHLGAKLVLKHVGAKVALRHRRYSMYNWSYDKYGINRGRTSERTEGERTDERADGELP